MTTTNNRALWELVEMWRKSSPKPEYECERGVWIDCADELAAILERPVVVGDGEVRLWDTQWMNIVNHDNCYRDWSKDDAIARAVKMTEEAVARNVADGKLPPRKGTNESMVRGKS
jgi:hypothetical protein